MAYSKDEMSTWITTHFDNMRKPILLEIEDFKNAPLSIEIREKVTAHLSEIVDAQNHLLDVLGHASEDIGVYGKHRSHRYISYNSTWQQEDDHNGENISFKNGGLNNYIEEKLNDYNRVIYKDEIRLAQEKLKLINSEENRLQNWLDGIGYNSKMSDTNKTKAYDLLVEAGIDPNAMERKFKYELTLTNIATSVTKGDFSSILTREQKLANQLD